ncbi:hypothetical protein [Methylobacterium frigidaeris]|uniref:hypothetical protein n=1 Tax=Methylobacterium frigidaeris TaxID=2038277 RepID=UPI001EE0AB29|nr:hypothetical protein [Methylobacterium frigidaeris]
MNAAPAVATTASISRARGTLSEATQNKRIDALHLARPRDADRVAIDEDRRGPGVADRPGEPQRQGRGLGRRQDRQEDLRSSGDRLVVDEHHASALARLAAMRFSAPV